MDMYLWALAIVAGVYLLGSAVLVGIPTYLGLVAMREPWAFLKAAWLTVAWPLHSLFGKD